MTDRIKGLAWAWGDVIRECMNGIWKKTLKNFTHDFSEFIKAEEVAKFNKAAVELANINLSVDEGDIEGPCEVVPEELTTEESL